MNENRPSMGRWNLKHLIMMLAITLEKCGPIFLGLEPDCWSLIHGWRGSFKPFVCVQQAMRA